MSLRRHKGAVPGFKSNARINTFHANMITTDAHTLSYDTIEYDNLVYDTGGIYDTSLYRWTPNVSGLYIHNMQARFDAAEQWYASFYDVTNATTLMNKQRYGSAFSGYAAWWQWQWWLEAGVSYDIRLYTSNTSSIIVSTATGLWVTGPLVT